MYRQQLCIIFPHNSPEVIPGSSAKVVRVVATDASKKVLAAAMVNLCSALGISERWSSRQAVKVKSVAQRVANRRVNLIMQDV